MNNFDLKSVKVAGYGYRPDHLDPRDHIYNNEQRIMRSMDLPRQVDISNEMPPIYDQMQLGSCTCNAGGAIMQHRQMAEGEAEGQDVPSRLFLYWNVRKKEGLDTMQDTGAEVRDVLWVLHNLGAPPETEWPYTDLNPGPFQKQPNQSAYTDALKYEATQYQRIIVGAPGHPLRSALANHHPVAYGFSVPDYFQSSSWDPATDYLRVPGPSDQIIAGHATVLVGYDDTLERFPVPVFKVRNSWGPDWGENGHFYMEQRWFNNDLASDFWVVTKTT